jgi:hypothetical protein
MLGGFGLFDDGGKHGDQALFAGLAVSVVHKVVGIVLEVFVDDAEKRLLGHLRDNLEDAVFLGIVVKDRAKDAAALFLDVDGVKLKRVAKDFGVVWGSKAEQ